MKASAAALSLILSLTSVAAFAPSSSSRSLALRHGASSSSVALRMADDKVFDQEAFIAESKGESVVGLLLKMPLLLGSASKLAMLK